MKSTTEYILDAIRKWVWSGFYTPEQVDMMIDDILEEDADEQMLRAAVAPEFANKKEAEKLWEEFTDCDRLDSLVESLERSKILFLQNAGYTMSDGHQEAFEILSDIPGHGFIGYCFYHGQDVERVLDSDELYIAFDHIDGDVPAKLKIGQVLKEELEKAGFAVNWDGSPNRRVEVQINWKRRYRQ